MKTFALLIMILTQSAWAGFSAVRTDDGDIAGPAKRLKGTVPIELAPDATESSAANSMIAWVVREEHGVITPVEGLTFTTRAGRSAVTDQNGVAKFGDCSASEQSGTKAIASLSNSRFAVTNGSKTYQVAFNVECGKQTTATFKQDTNGGQALGIWQIARKAEKKLEAAVSMKFWDSELRFVWPADADYYSGGEVHVTRGDHWDVVGHEMGHGIYDLGDLGQFGGGPHKIDECYSEALALSEGWASYFSAWVSVSLTDADAKFEYLVPRRAPIRFETIPADVCKGPHNEWRVTGFLWDAVDGNDDGEQLEESFTATWNALLGSRVGTAAQALRRFQDAGIDKGQLQSIWKQNFD